MQTIASRLQQQLRTQLSRVVPDGSTLARVHAAVGCHVTRISRACAEASRRITESARDVAHRLRTGSARGTPLGFDALVHPCTSGCTMTARQVHGLLLRYGQRYATVRLKVRTMTEILGWSDRAVRDALSELREKSLLEVDDRFGRDSRQVANGYRAQVSFSQAASGAPAGAAVPPCAARRGPREARRPRTLFLNSDGSNSDPRSEDTTRHRAAQKADRKSACPVPRAVAEPGGGGSSSLRERLGEELFTKLQAAYPTHVHAMSAVLDRPRTLKHPGLQRSACAALLAETTEIENPPGYLVGILRRQSEQLRGMERDLRELEAQCEGRASLGEAKARALEHDLERLRANIAAFLAGAPPKPGTPPAHATPPAPAPSRCEAPGEPPVVVPLDELFANLMRCPDEPEAGEEPAPNATKPTARSRPGGSKQHKHEPHGAEVECAEA